MPPLRYARSLRLAAPVDRLWPMIADTDRLNRAAGLGEVTYEPPAEGSLYRPARTRLAGLFEVRWPEPPFEWVRESFYEVRREYPSGPLRAVEFGLRFSAAGTEATGVEIRTDLEPRGLAGSLIARAAGPRAVADFERVCRDIEAAALRPGGAPFRVPSTPPVCDDAAVEAALRSLRGRAEPEAVKRLTRHLREAPDEDVLRMRPIELAVRWELDRETTLRAFLAAGRAGLLDATWELLCPNCRVSKKGVSNLAEMGFGAHCEVCRIDFGPEFESNVELRFSVHPSVRVARELDFCIGAPAKASHRVLQLRVAPGEPRRAQARLGDRPYFARSLLGRRRLRLVPRADGPRELRLRFRGGEPEEEELAFAPGTVRIALEAAGAEPLWVSVDEEGWSDLGATAARVATIQEFRDLYSAQTLAPGQHVAVRTVALLFTDLKDSTALYSRVGDAQAYTMVRDHFEVLREEVSRAGGAVVKTIGDAVMASFPTAAGAARAALAIQDAFARRRARGASEVIVKVGVHAGPALAVSANGQLDYFGTAVNTAARVQGLSAGGDVVMSAETLEAPGVRRELEAAGGALEEFESGLKGLPGLRRLWRYVPRDCHNGS